MIDVREYDEVLKNLGREYFVFTISYVEDLKSWAKQEGVDLSEPSQPMKLISGDDDNLTMVTQSMVDEEMVHNVLKGLGVRWALKDTASDPEKLLNGTKKRLAYCFLKEYSKTVPGVGGDDLIEDEWVIREMGKLDFFKE